MESCWHTVVISRSEPSIARMEAAAFMSAIIRAHLEAGAPRDALVFRIAAGDEGTHAYLVSPGFVRIAASTLAEHGAAPVDGEPNLTGLQPISF